MRRPLLCAAVLVCSTLVAGCGDDGPIAEGQPDPAYVGRAVDSGFRPDAGGFSFANFGHTTYRERFDVTDLIDMVGPGPRICLDGIVDPCVATEEAATVIAAVESARRAGHCEGMVVIAAVRHNWGLAPATAELPPNALVVDAIIRAFSTIFLPEVQALERSWVSNSLADDVALLAEALDAGDLEYGMGLYLPEGGHEVLPYAIEYLSPDMARVLVYDPNWPLTQRHVDIDLAADTWRFSFAGADPDADERAWTGDASMLDLNSIGVRVTALEARGADFTPPSGLG